MIATIVLAIGIGVAYLLPVLMWPNHAAIRNASGEELCDVRLVLYDLHGGAFLDRKVERLASGESILFRHDRNDLRAELSFVASGKKHEYAERYINLWRGEGWVFTVRADGAVEAWYHYPKSE